MRIVHLAAEFAPVAKAGGLGEMVVGLCRELGRLGETVDVIVPRYNSADLTELRQLSMEVPEFQSFEKGELCTNAMWAVETQGCRLHLLEARPPVDYFRRRRIYGCEDDVLRFLYFSRAALEYLKLKNEPIDILHLHDWHTAICAPLARDLFQLPIKAIVLTLHTVEHQGKCSIADLDAIGCNSPKETFQDEMQPTLMNLLKGGIAYADAVNTVSPTYAKEILTPEMGFHLNPILRKYQTKLSGILNGLDESLWNPGFDPYLPLSYDQKNVLEAKEKAREALQKRFSLSSHRRPWIGSICRLVEQKGPDLLEAGIHATLEAGGTFLLLGSAPSKEIQSRFAAHQQDHLLVHFAFDEELSHQIYAALDFFLMPSLFEPCGLAQMIAMRYGTIPIVRATGGLKDTVFDCEDSTVPVSQRNGFLFDEPKARDLNAALSRAIHLFKTDPAAIQSLIRHCMQSDFSWEKPVQEYRQLYAKLC